jgi:translation initiation factor IF-2
LQKEDKVRVYQLARELDMESKDLLDLCRQNGIDVKNQLSGLSQEQRDLVVQLARRGGSAGPAVVAPKSEPLPKVTPAAVPVLSARPRVLDSRPVRRDESVRTPPPAAAAQTPPTPTAPPVAPPPAVRGSEAPAAPADLAPTDSPASEAPAAPTTSPTPAPPDTSPPLAPAATAPPQTPDGPAAPPTEAPGRGVPDLSPRVPPTLGPGRVRDLQRTARPESGGIGPRRRPTLRPPIVVAQPPPLKQRPVEEKKAQQPAAQKKIMELPPDVKRGERSININDLLQKKPAGPVVPVPVEGGEDDDDRGRNKGGGPGQVAGRQDRHKRRAERAKGRVKEREGSVALLDEEPQHGAKIRHKLKKQRGPTQPRKGKVPVELPVTVRALSEAIGIRSGDLLFKLRDHGVTANSLNVTLDPDLAEAIALEYGCELEIKRPLDAEEQLLADFQKPDNPEDLVPRAPVVTIMGHVDHGKTSLLDKIRESNVAATEAGGITQVIRAWRVEHNGKPITFLDTPGHEAFTKMRARGAHVTDIAVIVVAADDGVMPQTEEAINHAKAANVPIVVAINKVDLPNANVTRTRQQLYGLNVLPDNMGGDSPFVETSAATGKGIDELLENLALVAELRELKANPNKAARGTCLEAMLNEGEGVFATLLVQDGTLRRGDVVLCGASYGRVRALYDDLGRHIPEAGPSVPVRITGLDEVPDADDPFFVVPDLATAREIAERRKGRRQEASLVQREPVRLETLGEAKIAELKVILKADFRGSIEAIRKELEKLQHEEVRVRILEAAIGGITENDVWLALTSPEDTLIVGFNAVPDERAQALADERGVQIREYNIIYHLTQDIRAALEGKLKPHEEVIHLGRASVRETFKISRVGTIAGCYVTQGKIERSAKVRVIRAGVVIYPPADRTAGLDSLKRYKEDVREVAQGFECGIKIAGYDDIKVDDVIEAYRVEQVQRKLS